MAHTIETIAQILVLSSQGVNYRDISEQLWNKDSASSTVSDILKRNGESDAPMTLAIAKAIVKGICEDPLVDAGISAIDLELIKSSVPIPQPVMAGYTLNVDNLPGGAMLGPGSRNIPFPLKPLAKLVAPNDDVVVIADTQIDEKSPLAHLYALAKYIWEYKPGYIVHIGDHFDLPSLSSYASPLEAEGRRLYKDLEAGFEAFKIIMEYTNMMNKGLPVEQQYHPVKHFCMGNHENRLKRFISTHPVLEGCFDLGRFVADQGWTVHEFNVPLWINGVCYIHYVENPQSGRPIGGNIETRLNKITHPWVQGHQQFFLYANRQNLLGRPHFGVVAGSFYLHDEDYRGCNNTEIRGFTHLRAFKNRYHDIHGCMDYSVQFIALEFLMQNWG